MMMYKNYNKIQFLLFHPQFMLLLLESKNSLQALRTIQYLLIASSQTHIDSDKFRYM